MLFITADRQRKRYTPHDRKNELFVNTYGFYKQFVKI